MKKIISRLILSLIILVIFVVVVVWLLIDPIAKSAVQSGASVALGVKTSLKTISVRPLRGTVVMNGLTIANPEGFSSVHLMDAGRFEVEVATASLLSDTVEIRRLELDGLEVHIEQKLPFSNVAKIMKNIKSSSAEKDKDKSDGTKVEVERVLIKNVVAYFHLPSVMGKANIVKVPVPLIELKNVSSDKTGSVAGQLVAQLFPAILSSIIKNGQGLVPAEFLNDLDSQVLDLGRSLGEETSKLIKPIGDKLKEIPVDGAGKTLDKGAKDVMQRIFGGQKETQDQQ